MRLRLPYSLTCGAVVLAAVTLACASESEEGFKPLFDGKTLNGWHALPGGTWQVKDGVIVGTSDKAERRHGLLVSDKTYSDFIVRFKFRVVTGNSGFYFRSVKVQEAVGVHGFQAEVDNSLNVSGLYETGGRAWVARPDPELIKKIHRPGKWNEMSITAIGRNVLVHLNGKKTVELKDDPGRLEGHFALQLHGGMDMEVMFKDIEIRCLPARCERAGEDCFVPIFNGRDLTGWRTRATGSLSRAGSSPCTCGPVSEAGSGTTPT